jgi:hypothetical protein
MGLNLKKLTWKKVGKGIGKVVDNKFVKGAAALGLAATGVGAPAAAALVGGMSAGGKLAQGKRLTTAIKGGVVDGGLTYVGGKVAGKLAPKIGGMFKGGGGDIGLPGGDLASAADPSRFRSIAGGIGKFVGGSDGIGLDDVLKYGKAGADAFGAYGQAKNEDRYRQIADQEYAANAPLRDAARQMLLNPAPAQPSLLEDPNAPRYRRVNVGARVA